jgi:predicted deacylase
MQFARSKITPDIDLTAQGKEIGCLRIPHSVHRSAYGWLPMPAVSIRHGDGPRVLIMAGNHGDEYEGQIAVSRLARELQHDEIHGHLLLLPMSNFPAAKAGRRTSPIDEGNLNRSFPGDPEGTPTAMIAHMIEEELLPHFDLLIDLHSGGSSLYYLPATQVLLQPDGRINPVEKTLANAYGAPFNHVMREEGSNHSAEAARRQGALLLCSEFGGAGTVTPETLRICEHGLRRALHAFNLIEHLPDYIDAPTPPRYLEIKGQAHYVYAPEDGLYEPLVTLGDEVSAGDVAAAIHFPESPAQEPVLAYFTGEGVVVCKRIPTQCQRGDCLFHLASEWPG